MEKKICYRSTYTWHQNSLIINFKKCAKFTNNRFLLLQKKTMKFVNICIFTVKSWNRAHWGQLAQWAWKSACSLTALLAQIKQLLRVFFINKVVSQLMTVKVTSVFRDSHCPCSWRQTHHHKHDNQAAAEVRVYCGIFMHFGYYVSEIAERDREGVIIAKCKTDRCPIWITHHRHATADTSMEKALLMTPHSVIRAQKGLIAK